MGQLGINQVQPFVQAIFLELYHHECVYTVIGSIDFLPNPLKAAQYPDQLRYQLSNQWY